MTVKDFHGHTFSDKPDHVFRTVARTKQFCHVWQGNAVIFKRFEELIARAGKRLNKITS